MSVRLGANPIIWSNDDLRELGGATPLETCLAQARQVGFEGMELGHKFPRDPGALVEVLQRYGLVCISGWYSAELLRRSPHEEMANLRPHLDLLKQAGSQVLICAEVTGAIHGDLYKPLSRRPRMAASDWPPFGKRLTELAQMTAAEGVRLVYHHHMGTVVQSSEDIDALMSHTGDDVDLLLDTGHASYAGADPVQLATRYASRIGHFHAKDVRRHVLDAALSADASFLRSVIDGVFTVPGDGAVDFAAIFRALRGYSGWVVLEAEQDPERADPLTYASLGHANLLRLTEALT